MTAPVRVAAPADGACTLPRVEELGAARVARWLLTGPAQKTIGPHAGAVAGWVSADAEGRADYIYPEITGYFLQWLAWMARCHGREPVFVQRAADAIGWLTRLFSHASLPPTRIYLDAAQQDWRNDALFTFDLAMVLRGIGAATKTGLAIPPTKLIDRVCDLLSMLVGVDGQFDACRRHEAGARFPDRWSTRRGPFLAKAASGIIEASEALPNVPAALVDAAKRSFDASIDALVRAPHGETHPFLYAVEGFLARPNHPAFAARLPTIAGHFDTLLDRSRELGRVPEALTHPGTLRLDIVAQTVRAGLLLEAHFGERISRRRELDSLADTLAQYVRSDGALPFSPDAHVVQLNIWTAMFAEQALALADREAREIARNAVSPTIV